MQTFLPYADFMESAIVLDKKRCWKQVVEASQIIDVLEGRKMGWTNHPAVKMWGGHTNHLKSYFDAFLEVCVNNHNINTKFGLYDLPVTFEGYENPPWWLGDENFHRAMRARLIEKDTEFYLPKFPQDKGFNGGKYFWPNMLDKTFIII